MRVAIAYDGRRSRESLIGNAAPAARLTGQNVRDILATEARKGGPVHEGAAAPVTCLMETWRVTPKGWESEDMDGFLIIHHGETAR